jgi:hypothetical protein
MKVLGDRQLRELLRTAIAEGTPIRRPTCEELATIMPAPFLLSIARRRGYRLRLTDDGQHIEFDVDAPLWHAIAVAQNYCEILEHMQAGFLGSWDRGAR